MLTPSALVSERGDNTLFTSLLGKLPALLWTTVSGCDTAWSEEEEGKNKINF